MIASLRLVRTLPCLAEPGKLIVIGERDQALQLRVLRDHGLVVGKPCQQRVYCRFSGQEVQAVLNAAGLLWLTNSVIETGVHQC